MAKYVAHHVTKQQKALEAIEDHDWSYLAEDLRESLPKAMMEVIAGEQERIIGAAVGVKVDWTNGPFFVDKSHGRAAKVAMPILKGYEDRGADCEEFGAYVTSKGRLLYIPKHDKKIGEIAVAAKQIPPETIGSYCSETFRFTEAELTAARFMAAMHNAEFVQMYERNTGMTAPGRNNESPAGGGQPPVPPMPPR